MESKSVCRIDSHLADVAQELLLVKLDQRVDLLMVDMVCISSITRISFSGFPKRTQIFCLRRNLCEQLDKVWQVIAKELGSKDKVFPGVVDGEF